jgi:hypothetical protein
MLASLRAAVFISVVAERGSFGERLEAGIDRRQLYLQAIFGHG